MARGFGRLSFTVCILLLVLAEWLVTTELSLAPDFLLFLRLSKESLKFLLALGWLRVTVLVLIVSSSTFQKDT